MIATVSPEPEYSQETLCTLNFASRVRTLKLGRVKKAMQREETAAKLRSQLRLSEQRRCVHMSLCRACVAHARRGLISELLLVVGKSLICSGS